MNDLRQTADAKVLWHFTMSLDGFVAGPDHDMSWLTGFSFPPGLVDEHVQTMGAVLAGRSGFDSAIGDSRPYGGIWQGPIFVLTHHPEDARHADGITFLSCPVEEAVRLRSAQPAGRTWRCSHQPSGGSSSKRASSTRSTCTSRRSCWARAFGCTTTPAANRPDSTASVGPTPRPW
jgi:hypothetical protein